MKWITIFFTRCQPGSLQITPEITTPPWPWAACVCWPASFTSWTSSFHWEPETGSGEKLTKHTTQTKNIVSKMQFFSGRLIFLNSSTDWKITELEWNWNFYQGAKLEPKIHKVKIWTGSLFKSFGIYITLYLLSFFS